MPYSDTATDSDDILYCRELDEDDSNDSPSYNIVVFAKRSKTDEIIDDPPKKISICPPKRYDQYQNGIYKNRNLKTTVRGSRRSDN